MPSTTPAALASPRPTRVAADTTLIEFEIATGIERHRATGAPNGAKQVAIGFTPGMQAVMLSLIHI
mgnify:CR=1 FL=1